jgi:hypothetical protein
MNGLIESCIYKLKLKTMKILRLISYVAILFAALTISSCNKDAYNLKKTTPVQSSGSSLAALRDSGMIITPLGPRKAADVHFVGNGYHLAYSKTGTLQRIENSTNKVMEDYGLQHPVVTDAVTRNIKPNLNNSNGSNKVNTYAAIPGVNDGWITDAEWQNTSSQPISYFKTSWYVPAVPRTNDGQLLYIFNGLQDSISETGHILQPVLQYGSNGAFGGNYWVVDNWYASCQTCAVYYGTASDVSSGNLLTGVMEETGSSDGTYSYNSSFLGFPTSNQWPVTNVQELQYAFETLETYGTTQQSDYPPDLGVQMTNIELKTGSSEATLSWLPEDWVTNYGQNTVVVSNNSPGGEVDLYFYSPPTPISVAEIDISKGDSTYYWSKTGTVSSGSTTNSTLYRSASSVTLPSGETASDIIGVAIASTNWCYYYYADGTMSVGSTTNATAHAAQAAYSVPSDETVSNILSVSIDKSNDHVYTWYKDGNVSAGTSKNLSAYSANYSTFTVAAGESISNVVGIGIAGSSGHVYAWYSDRKVSQGTISQFDYYTSAILSGF